MLYVREAKSEGKRINQQPTNVENVDTNFFSLLSG